MRPAFKLTKRANNFYTESQLELLKDLYLTYRNRGGVLSFAQFALIPVNKNPGDMTNERGEWTKFIRQKLAYEWDKIK